MRQIEQALNLDPKVKTKDVDKTISNLEKQYQDELQRLNQKFEPVIETLSNYVKLKKKLKQSEKVLKELGIEYK